MNTSDPKSAGNGINRKRPVSVVRTYPSKVAITEQRRGDFSSYTATVNWCVHTEDGGSDSRNGGVNGCSVKIAPRPVVRVVRDFPPFCGTNCPRLEQCQRDLVMTSSEDEQDKEKRASVSDNGGGKGVGVGYEEDDDMEEEEINGEAVGVGDDLGRKMGQYKMGIRVGVGNGTRRPQPVRSIARKSLVGVDTSASRQKPANGFNPMEGHGTVKGGKAMAFPGSLDAQRRPTLPENRSKSRYVGDKDSFNRGPKVKFLPYNKTQPHKHSPTRTTDKGSNPIAPNSRAARDEIRRPPRVGDRQKVQDILKLFKDMFKEVSREGDVKRVDAMVANRLKKMNKWINKNPKIVGPIPGVEVGDMFQYRVELSIIGLHNQNQSGIDYTYRCTNRGKQVIAISVVDSGGYENYEKGSGVLVYVGQGGAYERKPPEDQKLEKGNLALKNSIEAKNLVRVTRKQPKHSSSSHPRTAGEMYVYDGLYLVTKYWSERGIHGKMIFKFQLEKVAA